MSGDSPAIAAALARFEGLHPDTIELSLGRIKAALEALGRPQDKLPPVIHVAGTNGKGSTCAYLRAMVEAAGLCAHVFTSPHLVRFNERIRLAGELVDDDRLVEWLDRTYEAVGGGAITHFEATTAAALLAFSEVEADVLILEVGLGGRYDATNVIDQPAVSVITPVDYDHKQFLGTDLAKIAGEKAGIIKAGRPVVSAIQTRVSADVIAAQASALGAALQTLSISDLDLVPETVALPGEHQRYNAALAAMALRAWDHPAIDAACIRRGAMEATWPARMQRLSNGSVTTMAGAAEVWLDGGHNPHAAKAIAGLLRTMGGRTVLVCAMMATKDHESFFWAFEGLVDSVFAIPNAPGHAGAQPEDLARAARAFIPNVRACESFEEGMAAAKKEAADRILICGSLYLAGEVLALNREAPV